MDSAVVASVNYGKRYTTDKKLPDTGSFQDSPFELLSYPCLKLLFSFFLAIDLLDQSASSLRTQQESKPRELELVDRQILTLRTEFEALKRENVCSDPCGSIPSSILTLYLFLLGSDFRRQTRESFQEIRRIAGIVFHP
jgi:ATP-dependent Clp protease ATP-binding subunit ClpA